MKSHIEHKPQISRTLTNTVQRVGVRANATAIVYNTRTNKNQEITSCGCSKSLRSTSNKDIEDRLTALATHQKNAPASVTGLARTTNVTDEIFYDHSIQHKKWVKHKGMVTYWEEKFEKVGWGNCAEPHALFNISNDMGFDKDSYIRSLTIGPATKDGSTIYRCRNCRQWCPSIKNNAKLPTN